jgi:hypothetical protein
MANPVITGAPGRAHPSQPERLQETRAERRLLAATQLKIESRLIDVARLLFNRLLQHTVWRTACLTLIRLGRLPCPVRAFVPSQHFIWR